MVKKGFSGVLGESQVARRLDCSYQDGGRAEKVFWQFLWCMELLLQWPFQHGSQRGHLSRKRPIRWEQNASKLGELLASLGSMSDGKRREGKDLCLRLRGRCELIVFSKMK